MDEIHSGVIQGRERIVTMRSGVYGWRGERSLCLGYRYNPLGAAVAAEFVTTVDRAGARTRVCLETDESAVLARIPAELDAAQPVNAICRSYDSRGLALSLRGRGRVELRLRNGPLAVAAGRKYRVSGAAAVAAGADGVLRVPLELHGERPVTVEPG